MEQNSLDNILPTNSKVIVAILNWGLGHATRCIPIIQSLIRNENKVIILSDGEAEDLLLSIFPTLTYYSLPSYNIKYPFESIVFNGLIQAPYGIYTYLKERKIFKKIVQNVNPDFIISDNRFGCFHKSIFSIFLTHQVMPYHPFFPFRQFFEISMTWIIKHFHELWIPDFKQEEIRLSGELSDSRNLKIPIKYIGPLSRFEKSKNLLVKSKSVVVLLSGPEPQRSKLEALLLKKLKQESDFEITFIRGKINHDKELKSIYPPNIKIHDFLSGEHLSNILSKAEIIICRSGYSTIMDLAILNKKAILIPTPGQTEQEYLAKHFKEKYGWRSYKQKNAHLIELS